jgi:hypothetical protein
MPFSETQIFLEETSLVARPAVPFPDLKVDIRKHCSPHVPANVMQR